MQTAALEIQWTGTPTGVLSIDESNNGVTWYPTGTEIANPAGNGSADDTLVNLQWISSRYLSLSYVNASGAGTLTTKAIAKGLGG